MSIKEQVIEIIDSVHPDEAIAGVSIEFVRWLKHKIQAIPDEVTLREVKEQTINKVLEKIQDAGNYNNDTIWYNNYTTLYEEIEHLPDEPCERCKELEKQLKDKDDICNNCNKEETQYEE
jgi:predicted Zn-dependent peptidase